MPHLLLQGYDTSRLALSRLHALPVPLLQTSVSGRAPGNTAAVQQNLAVCGSQVYIIDKASSCYFFSKQ